jgi:hypothetical protein
MPVAAPVLASFKPARSYGWAWLIGLTTLVAVSALPLVMPGLLPPEERGAVWIGLGIMVPLLAFLLAASVAALHAEEPIEFLESWSVGFSLAFLAGYVLFIAITTGALG